MVGPQQPPQMYPLGQPESETDPRFTLGLVLDVADVLTKHGYPDMIAAGSGVDVIDLQSALFRVIYGTNDTPGQHTAGCAVFTSPLCDCRGDGRG